MRITIEEKDNKLYLALLDEGRLNPSLVEKLPDVTCLLLFDAQGEWLGLRLLPLNSKGQPLLLPSALSCDYPLYQAYLRQTPDFIEISFTKESKPSSYMELGCSLDVLNGELFGLELKAAKIIKGTGFIKPFIH